MKKNIICKINSRYSILLENVKEIYGHDDSIPFNADLFILDREEEATCYKKVAVAYNDGWGSESVIEPTMTKYTKTINELDTFLKSSFEIRCDNGIHWDLSLEYLISTMVFYLLDCNINNLNILKLRDVYEKKKEKERRNV